MRVSAEDCVVYEAVGEYINDPKGCREKAYSTLVRLHLGTEARELEKVQHRTKANHNESVCSLCMFEASSAEELKVHIQQHNHPKPFFCDVCNARFPTRASANSHHPTHSTEAPYSCEVCEKSFKWKHGLQNHMVVHGTEKKHLCAQCGFSTRHLRSFHTHELLHTSPLLKCPSPGCAFQTRVKKYLGSHLLTHNKEKPYQCEICGRSFSQAKNLHRHADKHDSTTFVEKCHLCLYQTTRVDKLVTHFKKHHPEGDLQELVARRKKRKMEYLRNKASGARSLGSKSNKNSSSKSVTPAPTDVVQAESVKGGVVSMECGDVSSNLILQPETQCQDIIIVTTGGLLLDYDSMNYAESDAITHLQFSEDAVVVGGNHGGEISFVPVGEQDSVLLRPTDDMENLCLAIPPQPSSGQVVDGCILEEILDPGVTAVTAGDQLQSDCPGDGLRHVEGLSLAEGTDTCVTLPGVISAQYEQLLENLERGSAKVGATSTGELLSASVLDASGAVPFSPQDVESDSNFFSDLSHIVSDKTLVDIVDDSSFVAADVGLLSSNPDDVHLDADSSIFNSLHELSWFQ
ncbi:zinc finger and BTB domain-containing protein 24-like [Bacillus rossius redtenbacheri]|uniref:zinc finger and BTB domain-containing protein 24-like n=1 Tax=Bacillus rossius redtenbacheri TaxID=93214 RepID=UPI002FDEDABB